MARVLVVEDDETIGRTLTSSLGVRGHIARWVMTGAAAASAAEQAHLRRGPAAPAVVPAGTKVVRVGALQVDGVTRRAHLGGVDIVLRAKELDLLARMAAEPGAALTRSVLITDVWDANWFGSTKTLDVHMAAVHRKLAAAAAASENGRRRS